MAWLNDSILLNTVRLETTTEPCQDTGEAAVVGHATGFIYVIRLDSGQTVPVVVTNRHVLEGAIGCRFHVHLRDKEGRSTGHSASVWVTDAAEGMIDHPNPAVDLCAFPLGPVGHSIEQAGELPLFLGLSKANVCTDYVISRLGIAREVVAIGYPVGLWDSRRNLPIVRRGIAASHPACDYEDDPIALLDIACFPGSSGSPVLIPNDERFISEGAVHHPLPDVILLGVVCAWMRRTEKGHYEVKDIPANQTIEMVIETPLNLGVMVRAKYLLQLEEEVLKRYQAGLENLRGAENPGKQDC